LFLSAENVKTVYSLAETASFPVLEDKSLHGSVKEVLFMILDAYF
jgi:hypothetical protein